MPELSIIMPSVNEYPQNFFTFQDIWCELEGEVDFEFIFVGNWNDKEMETQGRKEDAGFAKFSSRTRLPFLKVLRYDKKLSHWQAKNLGVQNSSAPILWFVDAHCIVSKNSLVRMFKYYQQHHTELNGTLHMPLTYMTERPGLELIYKLVVNLLSGEFHYSFTRYPHVAHPMVVENHQPFQVPVMSTCGMMMSRQIYDDLGGWPAELGIYGGGENFINFTLAVLGKTVNIFPTRPLYHYAEKRGYHWNYDDHVRNRMIATYIFGGDDWLDRFATNAKGHPTQLKQIRNNVRETCRPVREMIAAKQVIKIEDWAAKWTGGARAN